MIDAFIDFENVCKLHQLNSTILGLHSFVGRIPEALGDMGYSINSLTAFASAWRGERRVGVQEKLELQNCLTKHGGRMLWGYSDADSHLMTSVRTLLEAGTLKEAVFLATGDHHFVPLVKEVRSSGREVLVAGHEVSKAFEAAATRCFIIKVMLGIDRGALRRERLRNDAQGFANGITFPDELRPSG